MASGSIGLGAFCAPPVQPSKARQQMKGYGAMEDKFISLLEYLINHLGARVLFFSVWGFGVGTLLRFLFEMVRYYSKRVRYALGK